MERTVILLAVRPRRFCQWLSEEIQELLGEQADVVALERWRDVVDVAVEARRESARVVIISVGLQQRIPAPVDHLLEMCPGVIVMAYDPSAGRARLYRRWLDVWSLPEASFTALALALRCVFEDEDLGQT